MKTIALFLLGVSFSLCCRAGSLDVHWSGQGTGQESMFSRGGIVLKGSDRLTTPDAFRPPVEITIVARTDSTNLRIAYAADQIIFNWENNEDQLRVDGGPANGHHTDGAGRIPAGKYVLIRWDVTPEHQAIYVNNKLRFENCGNYSKVNKQVSIFPANGSKVTVKSVTVVEQ